MAKKVPINAVKRYIIWNHDKTEGFITDDIRAIATARTNKADRSAGYPWRSTVACGFYEAYGSDAIIDGVPLPRTQTVMIPITLKV